MSTASRGAAREHKIKRMLEKEGWIVIRCAGSKSAVDLWALRRRSDLGRGRVGIEGMAIQVKANAGSPWMNFRAVERADLGLLAAKAGADAVLIHWPPHGECRWYLEDDWPESKVAA